MTITAEDLRQFIIGGNGSGPRDAVVDSTFVSDCLSTAIDAVEDYITSFGISDDLPESLKKRAILMVGKELYDQRSAKNGVVMANDGSGGYYRVNADPLIPALPILNRYKMSLGFA